ncbi:antibiotic biosynthesis monooxygenase [Streptomyces tubbatahanensis]|uniref:Antibiotic biosynthesis monooxygenase n=1 Tax=Streptomyces tubbatahanensis TaxID=2923272 RepID=A0ABY3XL71_9ACTN|nr:putative quinol monooxygenase [Streptomyces tubbatahanensis]UNS95153.1 antibiotic biosynthesis monooxygenase [Streptomyces tubbatahanensis]
MGIIIPEGSGPIGIYGFARPRQERAEELARLLLSFVEPTRAEPGSWQYQVHRDTSDPTTLVFYELWRSRADLRNHLAQPDLAQFQKTRMDYLREDLEIHWLTPLTANASPPSPQQLA